MTDDSQEGYIIEFIVVGKSVKVTAMDPVTLREVSIIGARGASRRELAALAVRKLQYVMAKKGDS
jgi:hypothetical protein